ncbi:uncharacterized protein LOC108913446 isoform X3 [Anoplophora glabripennis]|uniref:uncharacterized protein LOC108913446 isoform X3 n=1 Tax=Anoplophora glabripennis TaxID=217634 RepID=UPI0008751A90|nr:uncharacterized protein LOC108913446 isoform X3 [Anoplophora glabripennis]
MGWAVIKFTNENAVEVVPTKWFVRSSKECFWPPTHTKKSKIIDFIKIGQDPGVEWKAYPAMLMGEYDDFNIAQRKATKAQDTDELTSAAESFIKGRGYRKPQRNRRYNDSDSNSSGDESPDDNIYPILRKDIAEALLTKSSSSACDAPVKRSETLHTSDFLDLQQNYEDLEKTSSHNKYGQNQHRRESVSTLERQTSVLISQNKLIDAADEETTSIRTESSQSSSTNIPRHTVPNDVDFKRIILSEISLLNLKLNTALEKIDSLVKIRRIETEFPLMNLEQVPQILYLLPIVNDADLKTLEDWLKERNNQKLMIKELSRIGGNSVNQVTRKIMYRTVSNKIGMEYSWEGAKKKKPFKSLGLSVVILESVRICCTNATETEIVSVIKLWLVRSKDRFENSKTNQTKTQVRNVPETVDVDLNEEN